MFNKWFKILISAQKLIMTALRIMRIVKPLIKPEETTVDKKTDTE